MDMDHQHPAAQSLFSFLLTLHLSISGVISTTFTMINKCDYTVWCGQGFFQTLGSLLFHLCECRLYYHLLPFSYYQTRSQHPELIFDPEIERTLKLLRRQQLAMVDELTLNKYFTPTTDVADSVNYPAIEANNFELKPVLISMVSAAQFSGLSSEDPNAHLKRFQKVANTVKCEGVSPEAIKLRLFSFSLQGKAQLWLDSFPPNPITTWEDLKTK